MSASAIIVVDVQNDFVEGGALAVEGGIAAAEAIRDEMLPISNLFQIPVFYTQDWHIEPREHFASTTGTEPDFQVSWPDHCVAETPGAEFVLEEFGTNPSQVFRKGQYAASYSGAEGVNPDGVNLVAILRAMGVERVGVVGIAFDFCVKATALDLKAAGFDVSVNTDATASVHPENDEQTVKELEDAGVAVWGKLGNRNADGEPSA